MFLDQLCGFCCFSMRFIIMMDLVSTLIQPITVAYVSILHWFRCVCVTHASFEIDHLLDHFGRWQGIHYSYHLAHHDWCCVWSASSHVHPLMEVEHGWMDGVLHSCRSDLFVHAANPLLLAHGWLLMGCYAYHAQRGWQEAYHACMWIMSTRCTWRTCHILERIITWRCSYWNIPPIHMTQFIQDAHMYAVASDDQKILLSQWRWWISSVVLRFLCFHILVEQVQVNVWSHLLQQLISHDEGVHICKADK